MPFYAVCFLCKSRLSWTTVWSRIFYSELNDKALCVIPYVLFSFFCLWGHRAKAVKPIQAILVLFHWVVSEYDNCDLKVTATGPLKICFLLYSWVNVPKQPNGSSWFLVLVPEIISPEMTSKNRQMSICPTDPCSVNIFKTLRLRGCWTDVDETWHL